MNNASSPLKAIQKIRQRRAQNRNRSIVRHVQSISTIGLFIHTYMVNYEDNEDGSHETAADGSCTSKKLQRGRSTWVKDYLARSPVYPESYFRRRFAIPLALYFQIKNDLLRLNPSIWKQRSNGIGAMGHPTDEKLLVGFRLLSSGNSYDSFDDIARMSESSIHYYFRLFVIDIIRLYGSVFLNRVPSLSEINKIVDRYTTLGFPGCIGAIDCMKFIWKNCPTQLKGQYHNSRDSKMATIQCEAWCDHDRYVWSWFSGRPGTNNDLNILSHSPLFQNIFNDRINLRFSDGYTISSQSEPHHVRYFLVDGIYPRWPIFAKPIHEPKLKCEAFYSKQQEAMRKDVECLFGILQSRFSILRRENQRWDLHEIVRIGNACVILHNMLVRITQYNERCEEDENISCVSDMISTERTIAAASAVELRDREALLRASTSNDECNDMEDMMLRDLELTELDEHEHLMDSLVQSFSEPSL